MQLSLSTNMRRWLLLVVVSLGSILLIWTPPSIFAAPDPNHRENPNAQVRELRYSG